MCGPMALDTEFCHTLHLAGGIEIGKRNGSKPGKLVRSPLLLDGQHLLLVEDSDQWMPVLLLLLYLRVRSLSKQTFGTCQSSGNRDADTYLNWCVKNQHPDGDRRISGDSCPVCPLPAYDCVELETAGAVIVRTH